MGLSTITPIKAMFDLGFLQRERERERAIAALTCNIYLHASNNMCAPLGPFSS